MKIRIAIILSTSFFLINCANKNEQILKFEEEKYLSSTIKEESRALVGEVIDTDNIGFHAKLFYMYNDSLLLIQNNSSADNFLEVYTYPSMKLVRSLIRKGRGPGEFISFFPKFENDRILGFSGNGSSLYTIFYDSLKNSEYLPDLCINVPRLIAYTYDANNYVALNHNKIDSPDIGIEQEGNRLFMINKAHFSSDNEFAGLTEGLNARNVNQGDILVNTKKNSVVFFHSSEPIIEFFDNELRPKFRLKGPDNIRSSHGNFMDMIVFRKCLYSYISTYADDDYIYAAYIGDYLSNEGSESHMKSFIFKFNWDGDFIESYSFGRPIFKFTTSKTDAHTFYVSSIDDNDMPTLYKLSLR